MIATERLILRRWRDADRAPFAAMGADSDVMRFLGPLQDRATADAGIDRMIADQAARGYAFWRSRDAATMRSWASVASIQWILAPRR